MLTCRYRYLVRVTSSQPLLASWCTCLHDSRNSMVLPHVEPRPIPVTNSSSYLTGRFYKFPIAVPAGLSPVLLRNTIGVFSPNRISKSRICTDQLDSTANAQTTLKVGSPLTKGTLSALSQRLLSIATSGTQSSYGYCGYFASYPIEEYCPYYTLA